MSGRRSIQITIAGHFVAINTTEVTPGRWAWTVVIDGGSPIGSPKPEATAAAALMAADSRARAFISASAKPS